MKLNDKKKEIAKRMGGMKYDMNGKDSGDGKGMKYDMHGKDSGYGKGEKTTQQNKKEFDKPKYHQNGTGSSRAGGMNDTQSNHKESGYNKGQKTPMNG